jgi:hypothetical protein
MIIHKRYYGRFCFEGTSDPPDADAGKKHGGENIVKNKSRIGFVVDYIKKNLHQKLSIDSIAKMAYVVNPISLKCLKTNWELLRMSLFCRKESIGQKNFGKPEQH